ncbi:MAG TPA: MazG nucleotide pyrophosphohydrolase domain-containing protein, partial [Thermomicrobiales bacterium]|nr:MazG nucleotide pyrophosphohydrolase domain-containing protein [Thermomicrobiales bacterium]
DALDAEDWTHAADELGDILGNLVMIAQIAEEHGRFTLEDAVAALSAKLVRRHPHVFGDEQAGSPDEVLAIWNRVKQHENDGLDRGGSTTE